MLLRTQALRISSRSPFRHSIVKRNASSTSRTLKTKQNERLILPDGRVLGYAEFGDPEGFPLLFFHGFPSSRLEAHGLENVARRHSIRVVAPERPGYGLSTFYPHKIMDWPSDIRFLTKHLNLSRFAILGGSGGGPYALACARDLPPEMMSAVGLMAPAGPWQVEVPKSEEQSDQDAKALAQDVMWSSWVTYLGATYFPAGLKLAVNGLIKSARWAVTTAPATRWIDAWLEKVEGSNDGAEDSNDLKAMDSQEQFSAPKDTKRTSASKSQAARADERDMLIRVGFEAFAQGPDAMVHEARLLTQPWGFKFEDIRNVTIQIWHGSQDRNAPIRQIRYMAERLPHCRLKEYKDEDHFRMARHLNEILATLVSTTK